MKPSLFRGIGMAFAFAWYMGPVGASEEFDCWIVIDPYDSSPYVGVGPSAKIECLGIGTFGTIKGNGKPTLIWPNPDEENHNLWLLRDSVVVIDPRLVDDQYHHPWELRCPIQRNRFSCAGWYGHFSEGLSDGATVRIIRRW